MAKVCTGLTILSAIIGVVQWFTFIISYFVFIDGEYFKAHCPESGLEYCTDGYLLKEDCVLSEEPCRADLLVVVPLLIFLTVLKVLRFVFNLLATGAKNEMKDARCDCCCCCENGCCGCRGEDCCCCEEGWDDCTDSCRHSGNDCCTQCYVSCLNACRLTLLFFVACFVVSIYVLEGLVLPYDSDGDFVFFAPLLPSGLHITALVVLCMFGAGCFLGCFSALRDDGKGEKNGAEGPIATATACLLCLAVAGIVVMAVHSVAAAAIHLDQRSEFVSARLWFRAAKGEKAFFEAMRTVTSVFSALETVGLVAVALCQRLGKVSL